MAHPPPSPLGGLLAFALLAPFLHAEEGWVDLFNGKDLTGWVNVNGAPETWTAHDGLIACTGKPIGALRTEKPYENFELELEWRHLKPAGNAGVFIWASGLPATGQPFLRAIEVQVLDNGYNPPGKNEHYTTHGDVFAIHGASMKPIHRGTGMRCFPDGEFSKSSPEWNHYRIVCSDGKLRLSVNGHEVSGGDECVWRKGYIGLESEGSPTEWRNIRLKELPSSQAKPEESAPVEAGWRPLYNGVDWRGWDAKESDKDWKAEDWTIRSSGEPGKAVLLWTEGKFGDLDVRIDVNLSGPSAADGAKILLDKADGPSASLCGEPGKWVRRNVRIAGGRMTVSDEAGRVLQEVALPADLPAQRAVALVNNSFGEVKFASLMVRGVR